MITFVWVIISHTIPYPTPITKARMTLKDAPKDKPKRHISSAKQNARQSTPVGNSNILSILHQPVLQTD